jgi:hypothetical protein
MKKTWKEIDAVTQQKVVETLYKLGDKFLEGAAKSMLSVRGEPRESLMVVAAQRKHDEYVLVAEGYQAAAEQLGQVLLDQAKPVEEEPPS